MFFLFDFDCAFPVIFYFTVGTDDAKSGIVQVTSEVLVKYHKLFTSIELVIL